MDAKPQLHDRRGRRLYLNASERTAFIATIRELEPPEYAFCLTLTMTGARISEGLMLTTSRFNFDDKTVLLDTLKKRRSGVFREIPVPEDYLSLMNVAYSIRKAQKGQRNPADQRLWSWSRTSAWRVVKSAMEGANVQGPQATAKGLRHGFAVNAIKSGVPLPLLQRWMGHASIETTAIYLQVTGEDEYSFAKKMW